MGFEEYVDGLGEDIYVSVISFLQTSSISFKIFLFSL